MKVDFRAPLRDSLPILEQFAPEPGFELENLLCLSYSLNPAVASALLVLCLPDLSRELAEIDPSRIKKDEVRRAVKDIVPRTTFVINGHDSIQGVDRMREFEHLIMHQVEKAGARLGRGARFRGSFHPKLLLAIYRPRWNEKLDSYAKLYIGSRNFTLDLAQEFGTVLPLVSNSPYTGFSSSLSRFLSEAILPEVSEGRSKTRIQQITIALKKYKLGPPRLPGVDAVKFHWQDRHQKSFCLWNEVKKHFDRAESIGIVSPWLSRSLCDYLHQNKGCKEIKVRCLGTETEALELFGDEEPQRLYVALGSENSVYDLTSKDQNRESEPPLHMKYYFVNKARKQTLFFGSANFTNSGLGPSQVQNTEILLQYELKNINYSLSGYVYEDEDLPPKEEDTKEQLHQEWLDALELSWKEFRKTISLYFPEFSIPISQWHKLSFEFFTVSFPAEVDEKHLGELAKGDDPDEIEVSRGSAHSLCTCLPVKKGFPSEIQTEIPEHIEDTNISALIRVTLHWARGRSVSTSKIVPIPEKILDLLRRDTHLPASLTMTAADYLDALAALIEGTGGAGGGGGGRESHGALEKLIGSITLDRFAYRMGILKHEDPDSFRSGIERIAEILDELEEGVFPVSKYEERLLSDFSTALRCVLDQLGSQTNE